MQSANSGIYFEEIAEENHKDLLSSFKGFHYGFVYCGAVKMVLPKFMMGVAEDINKMENYSDDLWVITYPRSGTTWTQEIVWLLNNNMDFEKAKVPLMQRTSFIEFYKNVTEEDERNIDSNILDLFRSLPHFSKIPRPRHLKTHFHLSLLPPSLLDVSKVIYVARNPLDSAVSYFYHTRRTKLFDFKDDLKTFWNLYIRDLVPYNPYFEHLKEAWVLRRHPNMFFIFYEELHKDMPSSIRRIAKFLGKHYSDKEYEKLCEYVKFENMKNRLCIIRSASFINENEPPFFRRGEVGAWREYFDEEMLEQAEKWINDNLKGTDLKFPDFCLKSTLV